MKVYVGQARGAKLIARLEALGFGEMTVREEYPPRRRPWAFDNGAFKDFTAKKPFDDRRFVEAVRKIRAGDDRPDFIVCPDIVAGGEASLAFSLRWKLAPALADVGSPIYLAVQDGMAESQVSAIAPIFGGIFVGGTLGWKVSTGKAWVDLAHRLGLPCHVGRVGTFRRTRWAQRIGADSIDSCLPLWSEENLQAFLAAFSVDRQREMDL